MGGGSFSKSRLVENTSMPPLSPRECPKAAEWGCGQSWGVGTGVSTQERGSPHIVGRQTGLEETRKGPGWGGLSPHCHVPVENVKESENANLGGLLGCQEGSSPDTGG